MVRDMEEQNVTGSDRERDDENIKRACQETGRGRKTEGEGGEVTGRIKGKKLPFFFQFSYKNFFKVSYFSRILSSDFLLRNLPKWPQ